MVAVTRKGFVKDIRRPAVHPVRAARPARAAGGRPGGAGLVGEREGAHTFFRLEECEKVGPRKAYLVTEEQWETLTNSGWRVADAYFDYATRYAGGDGDIEVREVGLFPRDVVLVRERVFGRRKYCDWAVVRLPWADRITELGWQWGDGADGEGAPARSNG